jgi:hypothetical protein
VVVSGVVVSVLATGPKVRGFDPDRGRWIFKGDKNPYHNFLRKPSVACRRFTACKRTWIELVVSVSKIQAVISHPSFLNACQMALAVSSGSSKNLCGQWAGHSLQNAHLPTRKPSGWNPKRRRLWPTPGCNAMEEEKRTTCFDLFQVVLSFTLCV